MSAQDHWMGRRPHADFHTLDQRIDLSWMRESPPAPQSSGRSFLSRLVEKVTRHVPHGDAAAPPPMHALVALQRADGSWDLTRELADALERDLAELEAALRGATEKEIRRAWATALAIVWLETRAPQAREEWRLLAAKASEWLRINLVRRCVGGVLAHRSQVGPNPDGVVDWFQLPREVAVPELIPRSDGAGGAHV